MFLILLSERERRALHAFERGFAAPLEFPRNPTLQKIEGALMCGRERPIIL
jgi:hypothetical protein